MSRAKHPRARPGFGAIPMSLAALVDDLRGMAKWGEHWQWATVGAYSTERMASMRDTPEWRELDRALDTRPAARIGKRRVTQLLADPNPDLREMGFRLLPRIHIPKRTPHAV